MSDNCMLQLVLDKISTVDKKVDNLEKRMDKGFEKVNQRLDAIGASVAYLEDDTPTRKEFRKLERRVSRLESSPN